ncbi:MAG: FtsX-like permease family protein [Nitrospira sp.]|jgi:putative ABC transport system permease protein|nr:FtsX-like permease family protein [Nitrospira sp.]
MRISSIAFANLNRRRGKALFLVLGIAIGVGTVVALATLTRSIQNEIGDQLDRFGANILVLPQSDTLALDYGGVPVSGVAFDVHQLSNDDISRIRQIPYKGRLSAVAPKTISYIEVNGQKAVLAGVDFKNELKLRRWWRIEGAVPVSDSDVLIGFEAAKSLGLLQPKSDGNTTSPSSGNSHHSSVPEDQFRLSVVQVNIAGSEHHVAGVIHATGGPEDKMIFGNLQHVQQLSKRPGQVDVIEVSALCKDCPVDDIVGQIRQVLPHAKVSAIQQAVKARMEMVDRLSRFSTVVSLVVILIATLMILTSMTGSVIERTREFGVLRAIGFRRWHIIHGLILEVVVVSALGGVAGWILGFGGSWIALPYFTEGAAAPEPRPWVLAAAVLTAIAVSVVASLYPVSRASRMDPADAVRSI